MGLIQINPDNCNDCLHCARVCPVHAIIVKVGQEHPVIDHDRCIGCGTCIKACPDSGFSYHDSTAKVKSLLKSGKRTVALVDPSISGEFPDIADYRKFVEMIRQLGFEIVMDVSFGVDLVARKYKTLFSKSQGKYYITANCPAIVEHVQKFHPDLTDNLAPIISPMDAMAKVAREIHGQDLQTVFIGPCISAKLHSRDFDDETFIDSVLTFRELRAMFESQNIHEGQLEFSEFDPPFGRKGALYPISNGILEAGEIARDSIDGNVITLEGKVESLQGIRSFETEIASIQKHFNVFYNKGCVMGPGMTTGGDQQKRNALVIDYAHKRLAKLDQEKWEAEMQKFADLDLNRTFKKDDCRAKAPTEARVNEILTLLGKTGERTNMCSNCGFDSCKSFAEAVAQGFTRTDMCLDFNLRNKNKYISTLRDSNTRQDAEIESLKKDLAEHIAEFDLVNDKLETSRAIMNQIPSGVVIVDEKLKITSSNRSFIDLLGEEAREIDEIIPGLRGADLKTLVPVQFYKVFQNVLATGENILSRDVKIDEAFLNLSVFSIKDKKVVGGIVRDMFSPEVRNEQIIQRVTEVIDQNLGMVQQIGFLLGEGASKTEAMLNSIIQLHRKKKK